LGSQSLKNPSVFSLVPRSQGGTSHNSAVEHKEKLGEHVGDLDLTLPLLKTLPAPALAMVLKQPCSLEVVGKLTAE